MKQLNQSTLTLLFRLGNTNGGFGNTTYRITPENLVDGFAITGKIALEKTYAV